MRSVSLDKNVQRSNGFNSGPVSEVFLIDVALVAPTKDVVPGMSCELNRLVKPSSELILLRCVATVVDLKVVDST